VIPDPLTTSEEDKDETRDTVRLALLVEAPTRCGCVDSDSAIEVYGSNPGTDCLTYAAQASILSRLVK
jgi:hypothetical protein